MPHDDRLIEWLDQLELAGDGLHDDSLSDVLARVPNLQREISTRPDDRARLESHWRALRSLDPLLDVDTRANPHQPAIAGYELEEEIGFGGMGVVYRGRHLAMDREVAIKFVRGGQLAGRRAGERFLAEARALGQLRHSMIVQTFDSGESEGQLYLVMELLQGGSLADKLAAGPLESRAAAVLIEQLSRAMQYAHDQGIAHRDLKPSNVLFDLDGVPKICDFGLAKDLKGESGLTQTGEMPGSPAYMAPEQIAGRIVTGQADVYALGAVLYELLTGRPPFLGETVAETLIQVQNENPLPPRRLRRDIPRDLEAICLKCLEKKPAKRYTSAAALAADLRRFVAGEPTLAKPVGPLGQAIRWAARQPGTAALVLISVIALTGVAMISSFYAIHTASTLETETRLRREAQLASQAATTQQQRSAKYLYAARMQMAQRAWDGGKTVEFHDLLDQYQTPPSGVADPRGFEWHFLKSLHERGSETFRANGSKAVFHVAFHPKKSLLATANEDGTVCLWQTDLGELVKRFKAHGACVNSIVFSPDGSHFATAGCDNLVKWWDTQTLEPVHVFSDHTAAVHCLALAPSGTWLVSGSEDATVKVWDLHTGQLRGSLPTPSSSVNGVDVSHGEQWILASVSDHQGVLLWDAATLEPVVPPRGTDSTVRTARFVREQDISRFVVVESHNRTMVRGLSDSRRLLIHEDPSKVFSLDVFPEFDTILSGHEDGVVRFRPIKNDSVLRTVNAHTARITHAAYSPERQLLATACLDGTARLFRLAQRREYKPFPFAMGKVTSAAVAGPSNLLALAYRDGHVELLDLETHEVRGHLPRDKSWAPSAIHFSYDSRVLTLHPHLQVADAAVEYWQVDVLPDGQIATTSCPSDGLHRPRLNQHVVADCPLRVDYTAARGEVTVFSPGRFYNAEHGPRENWILYRTGGHVEIWDYTTNRRIGSFHSPGGLVSRPAFSQDGRLICVGSTRGARLFEIESGRELAKLVGHEGGVSAIAFSPDGKTLATGSDDKTVRLWNIPTGQQMLVLQGHNYPVAKLAFSRDGKTLASTSNAGGQYEYGFEWLNEVFTWNTSEQ